MISHGDEIITNGADVNNTSQKSPSSNLIREPLKYSGFLDDYTSFELTPVIGTEFPDLQVGDLLEDDEKLRDLAVTISQRGVVFFRNQHINTDEQKLLAGKLGYLAGKPESSKIYRHFLFNSRIADPVDSTGKLEDEVSIISSDALRKYRSEKYTVIPPFASDGWHTDIAFEKVPSDYGLLHMVVVPEDGCGGDTLWASGYEAYDRLSAPFQGLVDGLTALQKTDLNNIVNEEDIISFGARGAPENVSPDLQMSHPIVRTNPVTGWKGLWGMGSTVKDDSIEGVTKYESQILNRYLKKLIAENHDLQVRFKWGLNDLAIWDNRSVLHTATNDYEGKRRGNRVLSLGEVPYIDPASKSRREALSGKLT